MIISKEEEMWLKAAKKRIKELASRKPRTNDEAIVKSALKRTLNDIDDAVREIRFCRKWESLK
jgi:oligoribonuclease (3'-5' exoribonuclease)